MADVVNPLQSLSYTNKDFVSIYTELLDLTKELAATWDPTISNESDPGVILLKLNAIIGDKLSYNSDTNVLELFPLSVTQEKNARQLFEQLGYYMHWYKGATTDVSIAWIGEKSSTIEYTIPAFTMVSDFNNNVIYTLIGPSDSSIVNTFKVGSQKLKLDGNTISFKAIQGIPVIYSINGETNITINNLDDNNRLYFPTIDVAENGIFITNQNINNYTDWKKVDNLLVQSVSAEGLFYKFGLTQDASTCYIEFPENAEEIIKNGINITYIKTQGSDGNVSYKTIEKFYNEISPEEDDTVVFTTDNIRMLNYSAAINGENPQSINSAYKGYKSTVGVFETLVTLRDYIGYILRSGLISNGFVCDRTNDIQCSYNIMSQSNDIDQIVSVVEPNNSNNPALTAFDLKLYLLQLPSNEVVTNTIYNSTFNILNDSGLSNIKSYIDDVKCISHDYAPILGVEFNPGKGHFCYFKNKYPISCRIVTQYQLTNTAANEVVSNIRIALYKGLNSQELTFGEEISPDLIRSIILNSDDRIKDISLDNIEYTAYAVCYSEEADAFFEIEISSEDTEPVSIRCNNPLLTIHADEDVFIYGNSDPSIGGGIGSGDYSVYTFSYISDSNKWSLSHDGSAVEDPLTKTQLEQKYGIAYSGTPSNGDTIEASISIKTQLQDEIYTKSILAGTTQFLVPDEEFDYKLDQIYNFFEYNLLDRIKAVNTELHVPLTRVNNTYNLRDNETIQLYSPNLIDSTTYSNYVRYEYRLENYLSSDEDHQLTSNEYFIMYWKESQTDSMYRYAVYGEGNIIKLKSFSLDANDGSNNVGASLVNYMNNIGTESQPIKYTDYTINNRMNYTISKQVNNLYSSVTQLSSSTAITIRRLNQITLESGSSYCYWILNEKLEDTDTRLEKYRLFEAGESTRILSTGEYFIFTNDTLTNLTILGAGTLITRSDNTYVWEVNVKDASSIIEYGISAFSEDEWFKISPSSATVTLTEQYYISVNAGSEFKLQLEKNRIDYCSLSVSSSPATLNPTINPLVYFRQSAGYGDDVFTYDGSDWKHEGNSVNLSAWGIAITGTPSNGDTVTATVGDWSLKITPDGAYSSIDGITWSPTTLKDFSVSYKEASSETFTPVVSLNMELDEYSWNARTLLAVNTSNIKEQILLENQKVNFILQDKYLRIGNLSANTFYNFEVNDIHYTFKPTAASTRQIIDIKNLDVQCYSGSSAPFSHVCTVSLQENIASGTEISDLTDTYTLEGASFSGEFYNKTFMSNFDLKLDGSQTLPTYTLDENLEIKYLSIYVYQKYLPADTRIHINDDGEIDLEFIAEGDTYIQWVINLPIGEYILPLTIGSEELETTNNYLEVQLFNHGGSPTSANDLSIMNGNMTQFKNKQKYFLYFKISVSGKKDIKLVLHNSISKNVPIILENIYKYNYVESFSSFETKKILDLINMWDPNSLYNYTYEVPEDNEIVNPLLGKSFFLNNHIFNKYTIPQIQNIDISIIGKK